MIPTLSMLLGHRMWFIPGIVVWGELAGFEPEFVMTETEGESKRILHGKFSIGGNAQALSFNNLVDQRGNKMPKALANPVVIPIPRGNLGAVVVGKVAEESFRLARSSNSSQTTIIDLLIIEMG